MKQGNLSGTHISELTPEEKKHLRINVGVKIAGPIIGLLAETNVGEGFVITTVDGKPACCVKQLELQFDLEQGAMLEGIYPDGTYARYFCEGL